MEYTDWAFLGIVLAIFMIGFGFVFFIDFTTVMKKRTRSIFALMVIIGIVYIGFYIDPDFHLTMIDKDIENKKEEIAIKNEKCKEIRTIHLKTGLKENEYKVCDYLDKQYEKDLVRMESVREDYIIKKYKNF